MAPLISERSCRANHTRFKRLSREGSKPESANSGYWAYANNFSYNSAGAVTSMQLGNGRWESTTFNSRLQPTKIALGVTPGATNLLDLDFTYGTTANNGNVLTQTITVPNVGQTNGFTAVQNYSYDSLNRLKQADEKPQGWTDTNCTSDPTKCWKQTFAFDRYGNRRFDEANTTMPASFANQAVTNPTISPSNNRLSSTGWSYDPSGSTTTDPSGRSFVYDAENKQTSVTDGNGTIGQYSYDGDGRRVKKVVPSTGETTIFVYDAGGQLIAEYSTIVASSNDAKVAYLTNDHLGSPRINTDANGAVAARHDYHPFGEEIASSQRTAGPGYTDDTVRKQFTGYERDNETELDFAQARYYSKNLGRFTGVDPISITKARMLNPQGFNLYAYVLNNPLRFTDPKGEDVNLANDTEEGRRKALLNATATLKDSEKKNIAYRLNDKTGKYELYVKDSGKINMDKASAGYKYLTQRIGDSSVKIDYTFLSKGHSVVASDGQTYTQNGLASNAGGVTIGGGNGNGVEVIVAEGGVPNGVKGLTKSGKDVQIAFPDYLVTAHELFGETLKYTPGNQGLQGDDPDTRARDSRAVIGIENEIRDSLGVPRRSGKDHNGTFETDVIIHIPK